MEPEPEWITHLRLQKLLYYVQGWALAFSGRPVFKSDIQAWTHGPVVADLYPRFADYGDKPIPFDEAIENDALSENDRRLVVSVWEAYKRYSATQLRRMTHEEPPWIEARGNLGPDDRSDRVITTDSMEAFFAEEYEASQIEGFSPEEIQRADDDCKNGRFGTLDDLKRAI